MHIQSMFPTMYGPRAIPRRPMIRVTITPAELHSLIRTIMWEIAENLHRADLTALERDEHIAEWVRLSDVQSAQPAPVESKREDRRGHRPEGGINAASRELGIEEREATEAERDGHVSAADMLFWRAAALREAAR